MKDTENRPQPRKRRKWGSVIVRRDADGNPTSFQARYVNPLDPPKKVGRNFGLEYETEAYRWLDEERYLVTLHNKGIRQWVHPDVYLEVQHPCWSCNSNSSSANASAGVR